MPDTMQCPAEVSEERTALKRENKALRDKLTATRTALEAVQDYWDTPLEQEAEPGPIIRLVKHTLIMTT